jgi:hypothetical protein
MPDNAIDDCESEARHNFRQEITDGNHVYAYDYGSVMHYPAYAFAIDRSKPTIIAPQGITIGQRRGLSSGDIRTVNTIYPQRFPGGRH